VYVSELGLDGAAGSFMTVAIATTNPEIWLSSNGVGVNVGVFVTLTIGVAVKVMVNVGVHEVMPIIYVQVALGVEV
jgi:hypothetical protein